MAEIVEENLMKVQSKQKQWYDKGARMREFMKGDPLMVLLPTSSSKLLAQQITSCLSRASLQGAK